MFISISLPGCIHIRQDEITVFGINRTRTLMFTHYKVKNIGDEYTKQKRHNDSDIILSNGTFVTRINKILLNMVKSNSDIKGILDENWTVDVINNTDKNGKIILLSWVNPYSFYWFNYSLILISMIYRCYMNILIYSRSIFKWCHIRLQWL